MRLREFQEMISEVPMNPTAYAAGIETGATKGVIVGFEFEVCVPSETISNPPGAEATTTTTGTWVDTIRPEWVENLDLQQVDENFVIFNKPIPYDGTTYENIEDLMEAWINKVIVSDVKRVFDLCGPIVRKKLVKHWEEWKANRPAWNQGPYNFAHQCQLCTSGGNSTNFRIAKYSYKTNPGLKQFWIDAFGTDSLAELVANPDLDWDEHNMVERYGAVDDDYDDGNYHAYDYNGATKVIAPELTQAFGKPIVFSGYHQRNKDMTHWYIEPDGSLEPNRGDGACEVVTPPLPVKEAIAALKTFYGIAKKLNLYTSTKNHTGLHINVSIPDSIDVLKLAVFAGDQYVLKAWGRENNGYASSVLKQLKKDLPNSNRGTALSAEQNVSDLLTRPAMYKKLVQIAKDISDDHMASISYNGKYVSFRHAGGDYLNDQQSVLNVVGRFIRAMVIAADPALYKNEYMAKLTKLVHRPENKPMSSVGDLMTVRSKPILSRLIAFYALNDTINTNRLVDLVSRGIDYDDLVPAGTSAPILSNILEASHTSGKIGDDSYRKIQDAANPGSLFCEPANRQDDLGDFYAKGIYGEGGNKVGIMVIKIVNVEPGTMLHTMAMKTIVANMKEKLRKEKLIGQGQ